MTTKNTIIVYDHCLHKHGANLSTRDGFSTKSERPSKDWLEMCKLLKEAVEQSTTAALKLNKI
eukprot:844763-Amphidinium_carterae.1